MRKCVVIYADDGRGLLSTYIYGTVLLPESNFYSCYDEDNAAEKFIQDTWKRVENLKAFGNTVTFSALNVLGEVMYTTTLRYKTVDLMELTK